MVHEGSGLDTRTMSSTAPVISFTNVTKRYGGRLVLDDVSFDVPAGGVVGLVGPNGAGKTTAIRLLLGLARPSAGEVRLLGARAGSREHRDALRRVGALVEGPALYRSATARANLAIQAAALGLADDRRRIDELLDLVGLADRADDRVRTYSLGMRQRLGIALTLVGSPRLLILDEPTNGLDPRGIVEIRELVRRLPERGATVLVSSHLLAEVELMSDSVVVMDHGRLVAQGPLEPLLRAYDAPRQFRPSLEHAFLALTTQESR
jgi:ABC-2 type transport system ATP-binding protein